MSLYEDYKDICNTTRDVANSHFLDSISSVVKFIDLEEFTTNSTVCEYKDELNELLKKDKYFSLNAKLINEFSQKCGELHFYCLCIQKGIELQRVPEIQGTKTPDFVYCNENSNYYFEVKTLSVAGGELGISKDLEEELNVQIYLEDQRKNRCKHHMPTATRTIEPYGDKIRKYGHIRGAIRVLSDKIKQNYKPEQFSNENTFMVVNLAMIHNLITEPELLNPVYNLRRDKNTVVSGLFWMVAFRRIGMAVFGIPYETNGYTHGIDGYCEQDGVLLDCDRIEGILIVTNPPLEKNEVWGLFRKRILNNELDMKTLIKFTGYRYNDILNTRGQCNNEYNSDFSFNKRSNK